VEADLRTTDVGALLDGIDVVFHQAAQAGVRLSWSDGFGDYAGHNILATQRLLEATRHAGSKVVYASSSSVYGNAAKYPTVEDDLPRPHSPYGVTKLAAEHLCNLYAENWGVPTASLRYFTVYGPRQRPDMAIHRLLRAAIHGERFPLFGDGSAERDFTFVADVVAANVRAAESDCPPGSVMNVAGGSSVRMHELVDMVTEVVGTAPTIDRQPEQAGDVARTGGSIARATHLLGWKPETDLRTGLRAQAEWHRTRS
jgi:nucleoside-diphosphate-sugar epimerase